MGRPAGKRGTFTFRVTPALRAMLEAEAAASERPVSEVVEDRLVRSFEEDGTRQTIREEIRAVFAERDEAERFMTALIGPVRAHHDPAVDLQAPLLGLPGPPLNG